MASLNSTLKFLYRNTATFFGVHVTSTPMDLSYSQITLATGNVMINFNVNLLLIRSQKLLHCQNHNIIIGSTPMNYVTSTQTYGDIQIYNNGSLNMIWCSWRNFISQGRVRGRWTFRFSGTKSRYTEAGRAWWEHRQEHQQRRWTWRWASQSDLELMFWGDWWSPNFTSLFNVWSAWTLRSWILRSLSIKHACTHDREKFQSFISHWVASSHS